MSRTLRSLFPSLISLVIVSTLVLAACGGGDDDDGDSSGTGGLLGGGGSGSSNSTKAGSCSVKLTGDVTGDFKGGGGSGSVGTDYWLTDDELRAAFTLLQTGSDSEKKKKVEEAMAADPRFFLLIINCEAEKVSVSIIPSNESKYKDVPFKKAGEYEIPAGGPLGGAEKPGQFHALATIGDDSYQVAEAGTLKITKFDESGIAGTFQFGLKEAFATGTAKTVKISGQFEYPCQGGKACK